MVHGVKLGSARMTRFDGQKRHYGYYFITSAAELLDTYRPYLRQAVTELAVVDALTDGRHGLRRAIREAAGQLGLKLGTEG